MTHRNDTGENKHANDEKKNLRDPSCEVMHGETSLINMGSYLQEVKENHSIGYTIPPSWKNQYDFYHFICMIFITLPHDYRDG